ncbi:MAG: hypothetical protein WA884_20240 [Methyloceanibacter sp.]
MRQPGQYSSYLAHLGLLDQQEMATLAAKLQTAPGVIEAVVAPDEGVAYLKIDRASFDAAAVARIVRS